MQSLSGSVILCDIKTQLFGYKVKHRGHGGTEDYAPRSIKYSIISLLKHMKIVSHRGRLAAPGTEKDYRGGRRLNQVGRSGVIVLLVKILKR